MSGHWNFFSIFFGISGKNQIQQGYTSSISVVQCISEDILWLSVVIYFLVHSLSALSTFSTTSSSFQFPQWLLTAYRKQTSTCNIKLWVVQLYVRRTWCKGKRQLCSFLVRMKWVLSLTQHSVATLHCCLRGPMWGEKLVSLTLTQRICLDCWTSAQTVSLEKESLCIVSSWQLNHHEIMSYTCG